MANELGSPMNTQRARTSEGLKHGYSMVLSQSFPLPFGSLWYSNMASWEIPELYKWWFESRENHLSMGMFPGHVWLPDGNVVHAVC